MKEQHHGNDHFEVSITLESLGNTYQSLEDCGKAKEVYARSLKIQETHHGTGHFVVARTLGIWAAPTDTSKTTNRRRNSWSVPSR